MKKQLFKIAGLAVVLVFLLSTQISGHTGPKINQHLLFKTTYYCPGTCCNGLWAGYSHTGKELKYGMVAIDPKYWKMGQKFKIKGLDEGTIFVAEDVGSAIKGKKRMDICVNTHEETLNGHPENLVIEVLD